MLSVDMLKSIEWVGDRVRWINTLKIPWEEEIVETEDPERVAIAIERMEIRGAPAIGVAAALGVALAATKSRGEDVEKLRQDLLRVVRRMERTRPTAVNLFWALKRVESVIRASYTSSSELRDAVVREALRIYEEDVEINRRIAEVGARLIEDGDIVLTHCNAGALATVAIGTALGVIRAAWWAGKKIEVITTETRPMLQGARLNVWELTKEGIPVKLITDSMVGYIMSKRLVSKVIVGADRIVLPGYIINKIGTYTIAALADRHRIPFYVAAPTSTIDFSSRIEEVVIEERNPDEVRTVLSKLYITIPTVRVLNPAFDITPPELVSAVITEKGVAEKPLEVSLQKLKS
ncbi:MAG: S-methyl-5-thioribose-1-phosphate isomerase [Sulfolobales archaeon]|nr:S-methyl-5-thioribose-1-phosphate isomerase [Sulfolobales archaeon]MDW8082541.1 S-methyl-5-thioribose-1-phosphate isomerase [Sulfolobales archaeon]